MKKILIILTLFAGLIACENQNNEFADFDYTTGYFPYQYPVRTLVLGDYIYDNSNDNNHKFLISAAMGGVYANNIDREFDIELAPNLCSNALFESTKDTIHLMPKNYYSLSSSNKLTIPAGKVNGNIEVQLTDAFFDDPLAIKLGYVIPVRIKNVTGLDSILRGSSSLSNPDPRISSQWTTIPRDFTMFAVKYINEYHGNYLHRGSNIVRDPNGALFENNVYRTPYIVDNEIWKLLTTGKKQVIINGKMRSEKLPGNLNLELQFKDDGTCTVKEAAGSDFLASGTGKYIKDGDEWGGRKRNSIVLSYTCSFNYTPPPVEPPINYVDDTDPRIAYTGVWNAANQGGAYNGGTIHYSGSKDASYEFAFRGDGITIYGKTGSSYGPFDVFLDGVKVATNISTKVEPYGHQMVLYEINNLTFDYHTLKVVLAANNNTFIDYLVYTVPQIHTNPAGIYKFEVKDTLVNRDRAVVMEVYKPVVF